MKKGSRAHGSRTSVPFQPAKSEYAQGTCREGKNPNYDCPLVIPAQKMLSGGGKRGKGY